MKQIIITFGPGIASIDHVRRLTNHSTGRLGSLLCNFFSSHGWEVHALASVHRSWRDPLHVETLEEFETTAQLRHALEKRAKKEMKIDAVFHLAALSDFELVSIHDEKGNVLQHSKIPSSTASLHLELKPAPKLIAQLRGFFPPAKIVGWKYEMEGAYEQALQKSFDQISHCNTDACVVNGRAVGEGFCFCAFDKKNKISTPLVDAQALAEYLEKWLRACL